MVSIANLGKKENRKKLTKMDHLKFESVMIIFSSVKTDVKVKFQSRLSSE